VIFSPPFNFVNDPLVRSVIAEFRSSFSKRFFLYGLAIAALEEFITQGALRESYFLWIFTLLPFAMFLAVAGCLWAVLHRLAAERLAVLLYYLAAGTIGLAVEWFLVGLAPWNDRDSPPVLVAVFHAGMFSFWGTVALAPRVLLDDRPQVAGLRRRFLIAFTALGAVTYALTFAAKIAAAEKDVQFLASIGPVVITFLMMNVFYAQYFRSCGESCRDTPRGRAKTSSSNSVER
jgi:hypothetical protein